MQKRIFVRRNSRPYKILKTLALGTGIIAISIISPIGGTKFIDSIITNYSRKKRFERDKFLHDLKTLQERKLARYKELPNGVIEINITKNGKEKMLRYQIDEIQLKRMKRWDKKWRLIMFDIPHSEKTARDAFRKKLKNLKFYQLQKSVFITPYPCEDEIDFISSIFNIRQYILLLYVSNLEGEEKLKHLFGI